MNSKVKKSFDIVRQSYENSDTEDMRKYYDNWVSKYENDVDNIGWIGWKIVVDLLLETKTLEPNTRVLDYGCGTGYAGAYLKKQRDIHLVGVDISQGMLDLAAKKNVYDKLSLIEGSEDLEDSQYRNFDVVICSGVFTNSHMNSNELARLTLPLISGGLLVVSARESYCTITNIIDVLDDMINSGVRKCVELRDAPYQTELASSDAAGAYWVLEAT